MLSVITDRKLIGGNVVGETLVYNFTFEATKDGFEPTSTGSFIPDNSRLAMSANGNNGGAQKLISLVPNKTYMVSFDLERGNYAPSVTADMTYTLNGTVYISGSLTTSASGHQSFMVMLPADAPAAQQLRFRLRQGNYNLWPHVFYVDNVTVTELSNNFTAGLQPDVVEYYDYDPFGMQIAKRSTQLGKYRYGFNGMEKDDELKGKANSYDFGARMYDPRVGRFFAPDPLTKKYPFYSPYSFSGNKVINSVELEGLEEAVILGSDRQVDAVSKFNKNVKKENQNWAAYKFINLSQAKAQIEEHKALGNKVKVLLIQVHGNAMGGILMINPGPDGVVDTKGVVLGSGPPVIPDDTPFNTFQLTEFYIPEMDRINSINDKRQRDAELQNFNSNPVVREINQLLDVIKEIEDGGTIILNACDVFEGENGRKLSDALLQVTNKRINILGPTDYVSDMDNDKALFGGGLIPVQYEDQGYRLNSNYTNKNLQLNGTGEEAYELIPFGGEKKGQ